MNVLVTGGAGYIGSHMARMLQGRGIKTVVLDTLERGHKESLGPDITLAVGDVVDNSLVGDIITQHHIDAVIHFAGYIFVGESVEKPHMYFSNNLLHSMGMLETMKQHGVKRLIFSSTAAVYGTPRTVPIPEDHPKNPESPYGLSKWNFEELLAYYSNAYDMRSISLRYFNAAGASLDGMYGESHDPEGHIIPLAIAAAMGKRESFTLMGTDYDTPDGTCIRDYIHVEDLCIAHIKALEALEDGHGTDAFNVGTGIGISNRQIVAKVKEISGTDFIVHEADRRAGDPHTLVADSSRLQSALGWKPEHSDIDTIVSSAWKWHNNKPGGYDQ